MLKNLVFLEAFFSTHFCTLKFCHSHSMHCLFSFFDLRLTEKYPLAP